MKKVGIIWAVVFVSCLLVLPVIGYLSGRRCMPLVVPPFLPAQIVPFGIGALAVLMLFYTVIASLIARRDRKWTLGALSVVVVAGGIFWFCVEPTTVFLYGLRDGFVACGGYPLMRQFAAELARDESLAATDGVLYPPGFYEDASKAEQERWDDLVARYPFLVAKGLPGRVIACGGVVELYWGSPLTGHWGFQVAVEGMVTPPDSDRGRALKVADDIQFVSYYD